MNVIIQDIGEGSPLWKLVTGVNQRLVMMGYSPISYADTRWAEVGDLGAAGVSVGANIQTVHFWRTLQEKVGEIRRFFAWVNPPADGAAYSGHRGDTIAELNSSDLRYRAFTNPGAERVEANANTLNFFLGTRIVEGDVIGPWLIEDLVAILDECRFFQVRDFDALLCLQRVGGSGWATFPCSLAASKARAGWLGNQNDLQRPLRCRIQADIIPYVTGSQTGYQHLNQGEAPIEDLAYEHGLPFSVTTHRCVIYEALADAGEYVWIPDTPGEFGAYSVEVSTAESVTFAPADVCGGYAPGAYPADILGVNCGNIAKRHHLATAALVLQGGFADLE